MASVTNNATIPNQALNQTVAGSIYTGSVNNYHTSPSEIYQRPEAQPSGRLRQPIFTVPFPRDRRFVQRQSILKQIEQRLKDNCATALHGYGGAGKTQIAIECAFRFRDIHPRGHVLWVHASSASRIVQAYQDIARLLVLPGHNDPKVDACQLVADWCEEKGAEDGVERQWLIIIDSLDDERVLNEPLPSSGDGTNHRTVEGKALRDYLPRGLSQKRALLATTRNADIAKLILDGTPGINVGPLSREEGIEMFHGHSQGEYADESSEVQLLLQQLGYVPLAITQAAAYISRSMITVKKYLDLLESDDRLRSDLLTQELQDPRRPTGYPNSIFRTWRISFEQINRQRPRAAELLALMAMLDGQKIPLSLLSQEGMSEADLHMAVGELLVYSLVSKQGASDSAAIHHMVQASVRVWLAQSNRTELYVDRALELIAACFPDGSYEILKQCEELMPHANSVMQHYKTTGQDSSGNCAKLLYQTARYRRLSGQYVAAHQEIKRAYKISREINGEEAPPTLEYLEEIANVLYGLGNFKEAERLQRKALQSRTALYDDRYHPDILLAMNNLAVYLSAQALYKEAESLQRQLLSIRERTLGSDDPETFISVMALGSTTYDLGNYEEAIELQRRALTGFEKIYETDHHLTLDTMSSLAISLGNQGDPEQAEKLYRQALSTQEKILGSYHPVTLYTMFEIGYTLLLQGKDGEVEELTRRVLSKRKEILGDDHRYTLWTIELLAGCLRMQKKYDEAEELYLEVLAASEKLRGMSDLDTIDVVRGLPYLKKDQQAFAEAKPLYERAIEGYKRVLGPNHPMTLRIEARYKDLLQKMQDAGIEYETVVTLQEEVNNTKGNDTAETSGQSKGKKRAKISQMFQSTSKLVLRSRDTKE